MDDATVLLRRIEELAAEVAALKAARPLRTDATTLRKDGVCPGCGARRFVHAPRVLDRSDGGARRALAIAQPSRWSGEVLGTFELYACTGCGLAEWYVAEPGALEELVEKMPGFRLIDTTNAGGGTYR